MAGRQVSGWSRDQDKAFWSDGELATLPSLTLQYVPLTDATKQWSR